MTYKFFNSSPLYFLLAFVFFVGIASAAFLFFFPFDKTVMPPMAIAVLGTALIYVFFTFYAAGLLSRAETAAILSGKQLELKTVKPLLFQKPVVVNFPFSDIKAYDFYRKTGKSSSGYDTFEIVLHDGSKYRIKHDTNYRKKDDFENFVAAFRDQADEFNSHSKNKIKFEDF